MPTVTVGGVGWSVVRLFFGTIPSSPLWIYHHLYTAVLTVAPVAPQSTYNHRYCRCCQIITTPGNPPLKYCTIQFLVEIISGGNHIFTMNDGKADHPANIIPPPHSRNGAKPAPAKFHTYHYINCYISTPG